MYRIPRSNYKSMPWKNGLGATAEIDRFPSGEGTYLWRFSQATICVDAPFSNFPGYDRWLAVWKGGSIFLNDQRAGVLQPIRFSGDENIFCRLLDGPILDVGLIFDRTKVDATMIVVEGAVELSQQRVHYIFDVATGDTLKIDTATRLSLGRSLLVSLWTI